MSHVARTAWRGDLRTLTLEPVAPSVRAARRFVEEELTGASVDDEVVARAVLLVSEAVTNAVLHAVTTVTVGVAVGDGMALVEVGDRSPQLPTPRSHAGESVTGRGLELMAALAAAYGVRPEPDGKVVWFTVGGPGADSGPPDAVLGWGDRSVAGGLTAELIGVPVELYGVLQEHNEALLREYGVWLLNRPEPYGVSAEEVAVASRVRLHIVSAMQRAVAAAGEPPPRRVTARLAAPADDVEGFRLLPRVYVAAEARAAAGDLLTRPALPELLHLRGWLLDQILTQAAGGAPTRWFPPAEMPRAPVLPPAEADTAWVRSRPDAVIVGDDGNRILAASPAVAALLGWAPEELVGRRIVEIVPPALRDAHVAAFTRHLVTGRTRIIGRPVDVTARHRAGHDVPVALLLEKNVVGQRAVFVATLRPR